MRVSSNSKMTDAEAKTFGSELKRLREEAGLTGVAFAELIGTSAGHISQLERGTKKPSPELAERIADAFNLKVSDMLISNDTRITETRRSLPTASWRLPPWQTGATGRRSSPAVMPP